MIRFNRSVTLLKLKRYREASVELERVFRAGGDLAGRAAFHKALAEDALGRLSSAQEWLNKAIALDPDSSEARLYLGLILEKKGDFAAAGTSYKGYLSRFPDSVPAMLRFGVVAVRAGYVDTGLGYLRKVVNLAPRSLEAAEARKLIVMWE